MTQYENGREYEIYIRDIIKTKYINCWLWEDIPTNILENRFYKNETICDDIGCDIIGINDDNTIDYIQCKNYSTTGLDNTININDLAGFYNFIAENSIRNAIVYYSGKLSSQILCRMNKIKYINVPHIKNKDILKIVPRDYQLEAYNKLKNINRSILSMPCGTGKTLVSYMLSLDYTNIVILTPLISTTEQILAHFKNYYNDRSVNYILINCKADRMIESVKDKNIIASTFDSVDIINKANLCNALYIIDEFHNLSSDMITNTTNDMNKLLTSNNNILFMSATPLVNTNTDIFGTVKYELYWDDAIKNKYICDYNFYFPDNDKIIEDINNLKFDKSLVEKTIYINKAYFLLESIKNINVKKCIVYLKSINESDQFMKILKTINIYFDLNIKIYEINCNTSKKHRLQYMTKFKNDNCINIICNVHILDEGIDIPECDSIYLTHPNNNNINIIQRISRANRLDKNNMDKVAKIFIWSKDKMKTDTIINNLSKTIHIKNKYTIYDYNIQQESNIDNENAFLITDIEIASYLNVTIDNIRRRLQNKYSKTQNFIENIDFIKMKLGKTSKLIYKLNYLCVKKIIISSNTTISEKIKNII
jgi:superfamily II DNA or RNA helicase